MLTVLENYIINTIANLLPSWSILCSDNLGHSPLRLTQCWTDQNRGRVPPATIDYLRTLKHFNISLY